MSVTESPVVERVVDGRSVPVPGTWVVDGSHSSVEFVARHLVVTKVHGRFQSYDATVEIGDDPVNSSVHVSIDAASITTGDDGRDGHLRSADFFDVEQFPNIAFDSTAVRPVNASNWKVDGELTIRGVAKPVVLDVEFAGGVTDPFGNDKVFFSASTEIDREAFGLSWNQPMANGGVVVGKKVKIELEVQAVKA